MYVQTTTFYPNLSPQTQCLFPILLLSEITKQLEICQRSSLVDPGSNAATFYYPGSKRRPQGWVRSPTIFWTKVEPFHDSAQTSPICEHCPPFSSLSSHTGPAGSTRAPQACFCLWVLMFAIPSSSNVSLCRFSLRLSYLTECSFTFTLCPCFTFFVILINNEIVLSTFLPTNLCTYDFVCFPSLLSRI